MMFIFYGKSCSGIFRNYYGYLGKDDFITLYKNINKFENDRYNVWIVPGTVDSIK